MILENVVNLTPHDLRVVLPNGEEVIIPRSGQIARVSTHEVPASARPQAPDVPVVTRTFGDVEGLPGPDGRLYVVSSLVLSALQATGCQREDVVAPDTGPSAIRDEKGRIMGITRFVGLI